MAKVYQVTTGTHVHTNGRTYKAGDKITSNEDLVAKHAGKFTLVGDVPVPPPTRPLVGAPANVTNTLPPVKRKAVVEEDD